MDLDVIVEDMKKFESMLPWRKFHSGVPLQQVHLRIRGAEAPMMQCRRIRDGKPS